MWLWYDWRAAAVADSNCNILDSEEWDGWRDTNAVCSRMDIIAHEALTPEAERLLERFPDLSLLFMVMKNYQTQSGHCHLRKR